MPQPLGPEPSICIVRLSAIGDVCHVTAVAQAIQRRHPQSSITWIIGRLEHTLLGDLPGIEFIIFDKSKGFSAYRDVLRQLKGRPPFDVLLQMQTSLRSNLLGKILRAKRKVGLPYGYGKELHNLVVNEHIPRTEAFHVLDVYKGFAHILDVPPFNAAWSIPISENDRRRASELVDDEQAYLLLAPSASNSERIWNPENYAALADYGHSKGMTVVVTGSPAQRDIDLARKICELTDNSTVNVAGKTSLKELLALCRQARVVIGPDSGTLHMATTQQTQVIGLYAHSNPFRTGPYHGLSYVANSYADIMASRGLQRQMKQWGYRLKGAELMREIKLETVTSLLDQVLSSTETRPTVTMN
jgi:heptosyltransferase I